VNWKKTMPKVLVLALLALVVSGCTGWGSGDASAGFWAHVAAAASALPEPLGGVLGPVVAAVGPTISALAGTHGTALVAGGLLVHHHNFGAPFTSRRKLLAPARAAHSATLAQLKSATLPTMKTDATSSPAAPGTTTKPS
jgi:hypothetical protein